MASVTLHLRTRPLACAPALHRRRLCVLLVFLCLGPARLAAQAQPQTIGRIEGDDIAAAGALNVEVEGGRSTTLLTSGSVVTVRSGQARLTLVEGGEIGVCGPAHFSLLKSGNALTLALDYGRVHARVERAVQLTLYTPLIVATPIAVGDGRRDATLGLEATGAMCVLATRGAVRVEQQFTGQSILVPQSGEVLLANGQLESLRGTNGTCQCEALFTMALPPPGPRPPEFSVLTRPAVSRPGKPPARKNEPEKDSRPELPKIPASEEPIYKVMMPPLTFDASAPAPPPGPSPETILLVREVRVRPSVLFTGRVEAAGLPSPPPAGEPPAHAATAVQPQPRKSGGLFSAIGGFFRRVFGGKRQPCSGAGCR